MYVSHFTACLTGLAKFKTVIKRVDSETAFNTKWNAVPHIRSNQITIRSTPCYLFFSHSPEAIFIFELNDKKAMMEERYDDAKKLIEEGVDVNCKVFTTEATPIYYASITNKLELVKILIDKGADVNSTLIDGYTILHSFSTNEHWELYKNIINFLLENGLDINKQDNFGQTALFLASANEDPSFAEFLINNGADVNIPSKKDGAPIHLAASANNIAIAELLLASGADIHDKNSVQWDTPLHYAATEGNTEMIKFLLERGANPESMNQLRRTPLDNANAAGMFKQEYAEPTEILENAKPLPHKIETTE